MHFRRISPAVLFSIMKWRWYGLDLWHIYVLRLGSTSQHSLLLYWKEYSSMSPFVFYNKKKVIWIWNVVRVKWQKCHFWMNCPFKITFPIIQWQVGMNEEYLLSTARGCNETTTLYYFICLLLKMQCKARQSASARVACIVNKTWPWLQTPISRC